MKKALLQVHLAVFLWGFTGVLGKAISLDSVMLVWWRMLITALSLWLLFWFQKRFARIPGKAVWKLGAIGSLLSLHWVCFYASIKIANVTIALTCLSTTALMSSILEPLILGRRFDPLEVVMGLFAVAGITIIYSTHLDFGLGIAIGLAAALFTTLVSIFNKKIVDDYPPEQIMIYQLSGGFAGLTLLLPLFMLLLKTEFAPPEGLDWLWLLILSWVCTILTFVLYIHALKKLSAFTMNLVLTLEPVYGILLAFLLYRENKNFNGWFYVGFSLISIAVIWHTMRLVRKRDAVISQPVS